MAGGPASPGAIVLDIEGTTTPIAFVYDELFPFARRHVRRFLETNRGTEPLDSIVGTLRREWEADRDAGEEPPDWSAPDPHEAGIVAYVRWLMDRDRKSTGLKALQGEIWREGYASGELRSQVFPDVAPALERWHAAGVPVAIFSSGSVAAQRLLFRHTAAGDLTRLLSGYFDTTLGPKRDAQSYRAIATRLGRDPSEIVFVSDVVAELDAARDAGLATRLCLRPGNHPQPPSDHPVVRELAAVGA